MKLIFGLGLISLVAACSDSGYTERVATPTLPPSGTPVSCSLPAPATTTPSFEDGEVNALQCFNAALLASGTQSNLNYAVSRQDTQYQEESMTLINGGVTFRNCSTQKATTSTDSTSTGLAAQTQRTDWESYYAQDEIGKLVFTLGENSEGAPNGYTTTTKRVYAPYLEMRFALTEGESFERSYQTTTTTTIYGLADGDPNSANSSTKKNQISETVTFSGMETVTAAAGIFDTCRFDISGTATSSDNGSSSTNASTMWLAVESGVLIKSENNVSDMSLSQGTLNGEPISRAP